MRVRQIIVQVMQPKIHVKFKLKKHSSSWCYSRFDIVKMILNS
jgi:hypothetical protein